MKDSPQLLSIFCEARERPSAAARAAYLDQACGTDADLRARVEALLHAEPEVGSFLRGAASPPELAATVDDPIAERSGTIIGPYKLLEQIGEGGFGVVFMAEQQQPLRRKVALKVLKPGMDTRQVVARFEAERQTLALMDHPNVAKVLDAGQTSSGRPFFVMDLVRGVPITEYCDHNQLPVRERLELFVHVCQAVQHAHQKGIIHRDLKPTNVLVTLHDGTPVPKIIDFGIAKALGQQLTDKTLFTGFAQMIGTPLYMSPEQAALSGLDIDTRSDIYSLGVLLYELLTGTTPFDKERFSQVGYDEMRRIIREEEPPRPSTRMSTLGLAATTLSAQRKSDPKRLSQLFRGELDWIVMKCLEKERNRRYETASGLARDIERYLHDEPVQACPPSAIYRFRKFARRNKGAFVGVSLVVTALLLGSVGAAWQAIRATQAEGLAQDRLKAETEARQEALGNLKKAREAVDKMLTRVVEERLAFVPQMEQVRRKLLEDALQFYQGFLQQKGDDRAIRQESALAYERVAEIYRLLGQDVEAKQHFRKAIAMLDQLGAESPLETNARLQRILFQIHYNWLLMSLRRSGEAEKGARRALELSQQLMADVRDAPRWVALHSYLNLALAVQETRADEAEKLIQQAIKFASCQQERADCYRELARVLANARPLRAQEAQKACREALAILEKLAAEPGAPGEYWDKIGHTFQTLAGVLDATGQMKKAAEAYSQATQSFEKVAATAPTAPRYREVAANAYNCLGRVLKTSGQTQEAEKAFRRAVELLAQLAIDFPKRPEYQGYLLDRRLELGQMLAAAGRTQDAQEEYGRATAFTKQLAGQTRQLAGQTSVLPTYRQQLARSHFNLGVLFAYAGQRDKARAEFMEAREHGRQDEARAVEAATKEIELEPDNIHKWHDLALAHHRAGNWTAALMVWPEQVSGSSWQYFHIAMEHWEMGEKEQARAWYDLAVEWMDRYKPQEEALRGMRAEAAALMGVESPDSSAKISSLDGPVGAAAGTWRSFADRARAHVVLGEWDKAAENYAKVLEHIQYDRDPASRHEAGKLYRELADTQQALAGRQKAEKAYRQSIALLEQLVSDYPNLSVYQNDLARSLANWATSVANAVERAQARQLLEKAIQVQQAALKIKPQDVIYRKRLANYYWDLANTLVPLAQHAEAAKVAEELIQLFPADWYDHQKAASILRACARLAAKEPKYSDLERASLARTYSDRARELGGETIKRIPDTNDPDIWNQRAWSLVAGPEPLLWDGELAVALAKKAVERAPHNGTIVNTLGMAYYRAGNWKTAIDTLKEAEELGNWQNFGYDAFFLAMACWKSADKESARKWYAAAQRWMETNAPKNEELLRFRAEAADLLGVPAEASNDKQGPRDEQELYTLIVGANPEAAWAYLARGQDYERQGDVEKAQADYRQALALFTRAFERRPKNATVWNSRGNASYGLHEWEKAAGDYSKAIELQPADWVLWSNRAGAYAELAQWDKAALDYAKATDHKAPGASTCYLHALVRVRLGDRDGYRKACAMILERFGAQEKAPGVELALWACVLAADAVTDYSGLLRRAEKTFGTDAKTFAGLTTTGAVLYRAGRFDEAVKRLNDAHAAHKPADEQRTTIAYTCYFLAMAHYRLGHTEEARRWLDQVDRRAEQQKPAGTSNAPVPWNRRLTLQLLRGEAEQLLQVKKR
jgi:serine/threonine protein kinase/tetratricopeptide (TPR) repeat protein